MSQDVSWRDEWFRRRRFDSLYHLISDDGEVRPYREMRTLEREQKALLLAPHSPQEFRDSYPLPTLIELLNDPTFGKMASRLASVRQDNDYIVFRNSFGVSLAFLIKIALQELKPLPVSKKGKPLRLPFFTLRFGTRRSDDLALLWLMRALPYLYRSQKFAFRSQYININFLRREAWIECEEGVPSPAALATLAYTHKNVGALLSNVHLLPKESGYSELTIPDIAALKYTFDIKLEVIEEACRIGDSFDGVRSLIFNIANLSEKMYEDLALSLIHI